MGTDKDAGPIPGNLTALQSAVEWLKRQSTETVLLVCLLIALGYGLWQVTVALFHEIPRQIQSVNESHERVVERVNTSHEKRSAEHILMINRLMERAGMVQGRDLRNIAEKPN